MNRRDLLKTLAALPLASAGRLYAAPAGKTRLLLVFLRGGYDAHSLLVPVSSRFYYEARPNLAIAPPGVEPAAALRLDADWGLHPALRDSIYPLFGKGQCAFIPFAGTDDTSRSHFETQDSIELGQALDRRRDYHSGFLNRLAASLNDNGAISFTSQLPLIFQGSVQVPNSALRTPGKAALDVRQSDVIASMYRGTRLAQQVNEGFAVQGEVRQMSDEMAVASRGAITAKGFELEARRIARLMRDKYSLGFVDIGGWDTHVGQGAAAGYLAGRLEQLGRGLAAYVDEIGDGWRDTVIVVMSEFGRTFRENGNRGTDHGHGTVYWVLGGGVRGGRVLGEQARLEQATLFQNRDMPVLNEYRALLGGVFRRMYGLNERQLEGIFAGAKASELGII